MRKGPHLLLIKHMEHRGGPGIQSSNRPAICDWKASCRKLIGIAAYMSGRSDNWVKRNAGVAKRS